MSYLSSFQSSVNEVKHVEGRFSEWAELRWQRSMEWHHPDWGTLRNASEKGRPDIKFEWHHEVKFVFIWCEMCTFIGMRDAKCLYGLDSAYSWIQMIRERDGERERERDRWRESKSQSTGGVIERGSVSWYQCTLIRILSNCNLQMKMNRFFPALTSIKSTSLLMSHDAICYRLESISMANPASSQGGHPKQSGPIERLIRWRELGAATWAYSRP